MAINGAEIVEQLRGRMRFYHVGDPVRIDMDKACQAIEALGSTADHVELIPHSADSVCEWLHEMGVKLTPKQRQTLGLAD
jgi:hypothetical protein